MEWWLGLFKWILYVGALLVAIGTIGVGILSTKVDKKKDIKIQQLRENQSTLVQQELLIKDLEVIAQYIFNLKNDKAEEGGRSVGLGFSGGFLNTDSETKDVIEMHSNYEFDLNYPNRRTAELILKFIPVNRDKIINKPIHMLVSCN